MKRFALILFLFFVFHFINSAKPATRSQCTPIYARMADTNGDCVIDLTDAINLQQIVWAHTAVSDEYWHLDLNQSGGSLDNTDILIMQMYLAHKIDHLPVLDGSIDASLVTTKFGDCNMDGRVNVSDLSFLANILAGNIHPTAAQKASCDVLYDGKINVQDLSVLSSWLAGNIDVLPLIPPS